MKGTIISRMLKIIAVEEENEKVKKIYIRGQRRERGEESEILKDLKSYLNGNDVSFEKYVIDTSCYTNFERKVLEAVRRIPYGKVRSYKDIAEEIGKPKAYRAVGRALSKNRTPILVPCHRVVESGGRIGGFTGGIQLKIALLKLEGICELTVQP